MIKKIQVSVEQDPAGGLPKEQPATENVHSAQPSSSGSEPKPAGEVFREAMRQVGEFGQTIGGAIQTRDNVLMVRVNGDTLRRLDKLVDAEICRSRSEAAAFLISEGIKHNEALYVKINDITDKIAALRAQLKNDIDQEVKKR